MVVARIWRTIFVQDVLPKHQDFVFALLFKFFGRPFDFVNVVIINNTIDTIVGCIAGKIYNNRFPGVFTHQM